MISFKAVELADKATIEQYTLRSECRNCDMSFANIYCWRHFHHSAWAVMDGFLVIRFLIDGKQELGYMQPIGEGDFSHLLPMLAEDAHTNFGQRLRLYGLCREGRRIITESGAKNFAFEDNRALSDYIYLAENLRTLPGRKYQPKRNHLNRFFSSYTYRYEELTPRLFDDCRKLEAQWRSQHSGTGERETVSNEQMALEEAFAHWEALGLRGGVLYVEDEPAAFTYGSAINYDTFDCHIEKADTRYEGIFAAINKLFADHLPAEYRYINREEDMGLEGLRRSKLSYHPELLWPKTTAILLQEDEMACKRLWMEVFGDEESFVDGFLMHYFRREGMYGIEEQGELHAMLHLIPFVDEQGLRVGYIYGVATDPRYRRRGYATRLLQQAIEQARQKGFDALALIPAEEGLRSYYERFGFAGNYPTTFQCETNFDFGTGQPERDLALLRPLHETVTLPTALNLHLNR